MKRALLFGALLALLAVPAALGGSTTMTATPNPAQVGDTVTFAGCGFASTTHLVLTVEMQSPSVSLVYDASPVIDSSGCFSDSNYVTRSAGVFKVFVQATHGHGPKLTLIVN